MNSDFDKEIDLLLRRRKNVAPRDLAFDASSHHDSATHLDVDELSAYAENALPVAARAHYAGHLADCERCRKIAINIALASGVAGELEKRSSVIKSETPFFFRWRAPLAALFTPRGLRYAVPVLVLFVTGVVFVATLRTRQSETYLADKSATGEAPRTEAINERPHEDSSKTTSRIAATTNINKATSPATTLTATGENEQKPTPPAPENVSPMRAPAVIDEEEIAATATTQAEGGASNNNFNQATGNQDADSARTTTPAAKENEISSSPVAEVATTENRPPVKEKSERALGRSAGSPLPVNSRTYSGARLEKRAAADSKDEGASAVAPPPPRPNAKPDAEPSTAKERSRSDNTRNRSDDNSAPSEVRSVAGRRFRRQGNAWLDIAYNSAMATINLTRGSEQYRALIADEPELRRIADQLGGEVIVVWKNRAYRIR